MRTAGLAIGIVVTLSGCYTPAITSRIPFDSSVAGFSHTELSPATFQVMYVGRWGAKPEAVRAALDRHVQNLCSGKFTIENEQEIITITSHTETEGGLAVKAIARCSGDA